LIGITTLLSMRFAGDYELGKDFVDHHKLSLIIKKDPIPIEVNIDGRPLVLGDVTHETTPLDIVLEGYHNIIVFNIIKSPSNPVVLSFS
jgi:hypothetical protein